MSDFSLNINIPAEHIDNIFGHFDKNIKAIEDGMNISFILRDDNIKLTGDKEHVEHANIIVNELLELSKAGNIITIQDVNYVMSIEQEKLENHDVSEARGEIICHTTNGKPVAPKTLGQKKYVDAITNNMIVFGVGPAGTGKTYLAMAKAITAFKNEEVSRIILTRPAIEAGEKLGFLPGDLQSKVDPYLRPLYDALYDLMGFERVSKLMEKGLIEIAPLAYMRGRTLNGAYVILDEAQNTTPEQMKMFLTRIGFGAKAVITGDLSQIDLPHNIKSGLRDARDKLRDVEGLYFHTFTSEDVVRHPLVQKIVEAYDAADAQKQENTSL